MATPQWLETKGGPTNYVFNLKKNIESLGSKVIIASPESSQIKESKYKSICRIFLLLIKNQPDVIHIHGRLNYILPAVVYKYICRRLNLNIIFTFHTQPVLKSYLEDKIKPKKSYGLISGTLGSFLLKLCDHRVSVSKSIMENINTYTYLKVLNYEVIPSGANVIEVDSDEFNKLRFKYNLNCSCLVISTIGVFSWDWKVAGHKLLLEALVIVKVKYPNLRLLIAGDGRYDEYLRGIVKELNLQKNVVFLGNIDSSACLLSISDLYAHMGLNEGFPLSIVEAMIQGKPIIAVNKGGIPEVITNGETGLLVDVDPNEIAFAIFKIIENNELSKTLSENAKKIALKELTWSKITSKYMKLYESKKHEGWIY